MHPMTFYTSLVVLVAVGLLQVLKIVALLTLILTQSDPLLQVMLAVLVVLSLLLGAGSLYCIRLLWITRHRLGVPG